MKSLLKLFLAIAILTLNAAIICADSAQADQKRKAELSAETLEYFRSMPGDHVPSLDERFGKPKNTDPYQLVNARKIFQHASADQKYPKRLSILQNLIDVFGYDQIDPNSEHLVQYACYHGPDVVKLLLSNKGNANATLKTNLTIYEIQSNDADGIRVPRNLSPLMHYICVQGETRRTPESITLLLNANADVHAKDDHGESVLTSLTFDYDPSKNISKTLGLCREALMPLLQAGIDLEYVNPQLQEKNPKIKKQLQGLSDYERLSVDPQAKKIMDEHRLKLAQTCHQVIKKMEESTELPAPLKRIIGVYLMNYPLMNKFPLSEQEIRSDN